jgi:hypothetical protein
MVHCACGRARAARRGVLGSDARLDGVGLGTFDLAKQLRQVNLQVLSQAGTPDEQRQAPKVLRLLQRGRHTMLVVLLLGE